MFHNMFKLPTTLLVNKNLQKVLAVRPYSVDKNKKINNSRSEPIRGTLKKVNIYGALGIASALLASYLIVRGISKNKINEATIVLDTKRKFSYPSGVTKDPMKFVGDDFKDEHLREQYNFIKKVVNECASAVFYLELRDPYIKDPETSQPMVTSNGSGFVISEDGWALTNAHVILNKPQSTITAVMKDGRSYNVKVEDADMNIDLALLKLEATEKLPSLQFGKTGDTSVGEWVVALGSPLSLSNSVTVGIISCVDRPAEDLGLKNYSMKYIQTDASITFGNSGGPLVNLDGNVIGINNLRLTSGISFAIPVEYVMKFLENTKFRISSMADEKKASKGVLGLTTISITPEVLLDLGREKKAVIPKDLTHGLLIWKIIPGSPAHRSGLEVGDIITHVNGIPIQKPMELYNYSSLRNTLQMEIIKNGSKKKVTLNME